MAAPYGAGAKHLRHLAKGATTVSSNGCPGALGNQCTCKRRRGHPPLYTHANGFCDGHRSCSLRTVVCGRGSTHHTWSYGSSQIPSSSRHNHPMEGLATALFSSHRWVAWARHLLQQMCFSIWKQNLQRIGSDTSAYITDSRCYICFNYTKFGVWILAPTSVQASYLLCNLFYCVKFNWLFLNRLLCAKRYTMVTFIYTIIINIACSTKALHWPKWQICWHKE